MSHIHSPFLIFMVIFQKEKVYREERQTCCTCKVKYKYSEVKCWEDAARETLGDFLFPTKSQKPRALLAEVHWIRPVISGSNTARACLVLPGYTVSAALVLQYFVTSFVCRRVNKIEQGLKIRKISAGREGGRLAAAYFPPVWPPASSSAVRGTWSACSKASASWAPFVTQSPLMWARGSLERVVLQQPGWQLECEAATHALAGLLEINVFQS